MFKSMARSLALARALGARQCAYSSSAQTSALKEHAILSLSQSFLVLTGAGNQPDAAYRLPLQYLRRMSPQYFDPDTDQRIDVPIDGPTGKRNGPIGASEATADAIGLEVDDKVLRLSWADETVSEFDLEWIESVMLPKTEPILWGSELDLRTTVGVPFNEITKDSKRALSYLHRYGILLVSEMPSDAESLSAFAAAVSGGELKSLDTQSLLPSYLSSKQPDYEQMNSITDGPMRNLYGSIWSTNSVHMVEGTSVADSAYTSDALPVHTDMTYYQHPPGLQVFNMVSPASEGGESVFVDGFAVAEELRKVDKDAFNTLCSVENVYRCVDTSTGWHLEAKGSTIVAKIKANGEWGELEMIRHNDLDRLPSLPPREIMEDNDEQACAKFYAGLDQAYLALDKLLSDDRFRVVIKLNAGEMVAVANQRTLHGRQVFTMDAQSSRSVSGCYVSQDELDSRIRVNRLY